MKQTLTGAENFLCLMAANVIINFEDIEYYDNLIGNPYIDFILSKYKELARTEREITEEELSYVVGEGIKTNDDPFVIEEYHKYIEEIFFCISTIFNGDLEEEYLHTTFNEFYKKRAMQSLMLGEGNLLLNDGKLEELKLKMDTILSSTIMDDNLGTGFIETLEGRAESYKKPDYMQRQPTGFPSLDRVMRGGLGDGELGIVLGAPGMGKSITLNTIAVNNIILNNFGIYYSLEMLEEEILRRVDSAISMIDYWQLGDKITNLVGSVKNRLKKLDKELFVAKYLPTGEATIADLETHLKKVIAKYNKPKYIIIDYGDLLKGFGKFANGYEEQGWIFRRIKGLALKYDVPIWSATQATRLALSRKVITMEHIADSIEKARVANFIVALCQTPDEKPLNQMRFFVAKARNTMSGIELPMKIKYNLDYITCDEGRSLSAEYEQQTSTQILKGKMMKVGV
jgi:hypothetical protein